MPDFESGGSHGHQEFIEKCGAVVMGRTTFEPAVGSSHWPWEGHQVFVLTSRPPHLFRGGLRLTEPGTPPLGLVLESQRTFPDWTVELTYVPADAAQ